MCVFMCVCMYKLVRFNGESLLQSPVLAVSVDKEVGWDWGHIARRQATHAEALLPKKIQLIQDLPPLHTTPQHTHQLLISLDF